MAENQPEQKTELPLSSLSRALVSRRSHRSLASQFRSNRSARDVEAPGDAHSDPLGLSPLIKAESEISSIQVEKKRKLSVHPEKPVKEFYEVQNEEIRSFLMPVEQHQQSLEDTQTASGLRYQIAVKGSLCANVCLSGLQLYAAISSGSLSLITTMVDSCFDPFSGLLLYLAHRTVTKASPTKYPVGRARISTAGNIVFSFVMFTVSVVILVQALQTFIKGSTAETRPFFLPSILSVSAAFFTKFCLFLYCWTIKHLFSQVDILWRDHRNDLFLNGFGILTSVGGSKLRWWIDPMGATILSVTIAALWLHTAYDEFQLIIGVSAERETLRLITYIAMTHSPEIQQIDTVRAYYCGPRLIAEVDVVMSKDERVEVAHDVAEALQIKLEKLPSVERAYVHIDYETSHKPP
ncbi:hypothetical protein Daus18300_011588 [Diaporthe australafricana]|uniref:Cation diffusion facilitator 1 n=1 Tax=Diaporthe australafricana TaxID=127596 RepID=A0ABR3W5U4_9PEZI